MSARIRKLIGTAVLLLFVLLYVGLAARLSVHVPKHWAAQLAFYAFTGLLWGVPVLPLITWMNRGR